LARIEQAKRLIRLNSAIEVWSILRGPAINEGIDTSFAPIGPPRLEALVVNWTAKNPPLTRLSCKVPAKTKVE
jgi:hypothetical protein